MERKRLTVAVADGAIDPPQRFDRLKNQWAATICIDEAQHSGLGRMFWKHTNTKPDKFIVPNGLRVNTPVEFASDDKSKSPFRERERIYFIVVRITKAEIEFEQYSTGQAACNASLEANKVNTEFPVGSVSRLVINAGICEHGWMLASGEIVSEPHQRITVAGTTWVLDRSEPGCWEYVQG